MIPKKWFQFNGMFVCAPPKCGGTALYCAALGIDPELGRNVFSEARKRTEFCTPGEIDPARAIMAVRDPVQRFASLWRDKCRRRDENFPEMYGKEPEELLEFVTIRPYMDHHWAPQIVHWRPGVRLVMHSDLLPILGLSNATINATVKSDSDPEMPVDAILAHYAQDTWLCSV